MFTRLADKTGAVLPPGAVLPQVTLLKALFAFAILLSISLSILASDVGMHPK